MVKINIMMDSGAFSAWRRNTEIKLKEYVAFLKEWGHLFEFYINLDCMPEFGGTGVEMFDRAAEISYRNFCRIKDKGLNPLAVFHQGESFEYLQKYLDLGEDFICISSRKTLPMTKQSEFFRQCFDYLSIHAAKPVRIHGLGVGTPSVIKSYPFYSTDSTGWALTPIYGNVPIPPYRGGEFDFSSGKLFNLSVTTGSSASNTFKNIRNIGDDPRRVFDVLCEKFGLDPMKVCNVSIDRRVLACLTFAEFVKNVPPPPRVWKHRGGGLVAPSNKKNIYTMSEKFRFFYAPGYSNRHILDRCDRVDRLHTFYDFVTLKSAKSRDRAMEDLKDMVTLGKFTRGAPDQTKSYRCAVKKYSQFIRSTRADCLLDRCKEYEENGDT